MKITKVFNQNYDSAQADIMKAIDIFDRIGTTIKEDRNTVKYMEIKGIPLVVKSFVRITSANRLIYGNLRKSKAQRAYENAEYLIKQDIPTPVPIAYIDYYQRHILIGSYFISLFTQGETAQELLSLPVFISHDALVDFARFTYKLHCHGIFHADYSPNNVLYTHSPEGYQYCLIDNNRIRFRRYTRQRAMRNMRRMNLPLDRYAVFTMEYSRLEQSDAYETARIMLIYFLARKVFMNQKNAVKNWLKKIF